MISRRLLCVISLCALSLPILQRPLPAQDAPQPVVYASYYECEPARSARVDSLTRTFWGPLMDNHIKAGHAAAWGWLTHHTGSSWDRVFYVVAPDINNALMTVEGLLSDATKANPAARRETSDACPVHEDYIWQRMSGSQPATQLAVARPGAGFSIYYVCDPAREQRADALVNSAFAPILNRLVQSGDLSTWSWLQHLVGGKYRRLLVTDAKDAATVIGAIGKASTELRAQQATSFQEFSQICNSHQDVVWNITISKP